MLQRAWTALVAGEGGPKDADADGVDEGEAGEGERRVEGGGEQRADLRSEGGERGRHLVQMEHVKM